MENKNVALKEALLNFLEAFDKSWYAIEEPVTLLSKYFDLKADSKWWVWITLHTQDWDINLNWTQDIDLADLQSTINWLKNRATICLRNEFWINV